MVSSLSERVRIHSLDTVVIRRARAVGTSGVRARAIKVRNGGPSSSINNARRDTSTRAPNQLLGRSPAAVGRRAPAEFVAERPVEAMPGEPNHRERGVAAANRHAIPGVQGDLNLSVDHQRGGEAGAWGVTS